ncbi:MAG: prepilin-type N-terminal cleavage/methylation domain-containing protein [Planctomycetota bacterium]|nr:MAG: prepilin-type N-terminal cleavage/methylation domain-containing protein [Planctomycetota bacterium]
MQRQGLTLIELLVVLSVIAVLMGITFGGLTRSRGGEGLESVASLTANLIRQARHTAISSGAPVELRVRENAQGRHEISGISQLLIHGEQFEDSTTFAMSDLPLGFAGYGFPVQASHSWQASSARIALLRRDSDSFFGELYYRPPAIHPGEDPILLVSIAYSANGDPLDVGLYPPADPGGEWRAFVGIDGGPEAEAPIPLQAGSFTRIGWSYGDGRLELLLDQQSAATIQWAPHDLSGTHTLQITFGSDDPDHDLGIIDNFRLMRLGANNPVLLPVGIEPEDDYRLLITPDGRVFSPDSELTGNDTTDWIFGYIGPGEGLYEEATLTIDAVGRVSIYTPLQKPPGNPDEEN